MIMNEYLLNRLILDRICSANMLAFIKIKRKLTMIFLKKLPLPLMITAIGFLSGCASTTIYPEPNNTFSLVTTSSDQGYAEKDALKKATEHCQTSGRRLVVLKHNTIYQGADKNNAALIGLASAVIGTGNTAKSAEDYQVTMKFKCE